MLHTLGSGTGKMNAPRRQRDGYFKLLGALLNDLAVGLPLSARVRILPVIVDAVEPVLIHDSLNVLRNGINFLVDKILCQIKIIIPRAVLHVKSDCGPDAYRPVANNVLERLQIGGKELLPLIVDDVCIAVHCQFTDDDDICHNVIIAAEALIMAVAQLNDFILVDRKVLTDLHLPVVFRLLIDLQPVQLDGAVRFGNLYTQLGGRDILKGTHAVIHNAVLFVKHFPFAVLITVQAEQIDMVAGLLQNYRIKGDLPPKINFCTVSRLGLPVGKRRRAEQCTG